MREVFKCSFNWCYVIGFYWWIKHYLYEQKDKISQKINKPPFASNILSPQNNPTFQPDQQAKPNLTASAQRKDRITRIQSDLAVVQNQNKTQKNQKKIKRGVEKIQSNPWHIKCDLCKKQYGSAVSLNLHLRIKHSK